MVSNYMYAVLFLLVSLSSSEGSEVVCVDGWCEETSALPLVSTVHQLLTVNKMALEKLNTWKASKIYTLSFIGPGRKGKSTLATRFIPCDPENPGGFRVGSTMEPVTDGIDIWGEEIPFKSGSLLLLDVEGTDNPFGNLHHQRRLSAVVSLLSSLVIYNVMDTLTTHDIDKLAELIDFRQMVKYNSETDSWPALVILIQNSRLQFTSKGKPLTNDQFLEYLLENKGDDHDRSRNLIKSFFSFRTLHVLPPPSPQDLHLVRCPANTDTPYYEAFKTFKEAVEKIMPLKAFGERVASPKDLARYIPELIDGANSDEIDLPTIQSRINEKRVQALLSAVSHEHPFPPLPKDCDPIYKEQVRAVLNTREKIFIKRLEDQGITGARSQPEDILRLRKIYGGTMTNYSNPEYEPLLIGSDRSCVKKYRQDTELNLSNHPLATNFLPKDKLVIRNNLKDLSDKAFTEFESKLKGVILPSDELDLHRALLTTYIQQVYARIVKGLQEHIESLAFYHPKICPFTLYKEKIHKEKQEILSEFVAEIGDILPPSEVDLHKRILSASLDTVERKRAEEQREFCRPNTKALLYMKGPNIICKIYYFDDALNKIGDLSKQDWIRLEEEKQSPRFREQSRQLARGTSVDALEKWIKERDYLKENILKDCDALDSY